MRLAEISVHPRMWHLPKGRTKNGEAHEVPLADQVIAILQELPKIAGDGFAFTSAGVTPVSGFSRAKAGLDLLMADVGPERRHRRALSRGSSTIFGGLARAARRNVDEVEGVARGPGRVQIPDIDSLQADASGPI